MNYQICEVRDGAWDLTDHTEWPEPGIAVASLSWKYGEPLMAEVDDRGVWVVRKCGTRDVVACVRPMRELPAAIPGQPAPTWRPGPMRRWRGLTWVGWLNFLLLRWFLVRIVYTVEDDETISRWQLKFCPSWRW